MNKFTQSLLIVAVLAVFNQFILANTLQVKGLSLGYANAVVCSPDGQFIAVADESMVKIKELGSSDRVIAHLAQKGKIHTLQYSPDGRFLAVAYQSATGFLNLYSDHGMSLWDLSTNTDLSSTTLSVLQKAHENQISALTFSPDGKFLASGSYDGFIKIWNLQTSRCVLKMYNESTVFDLKYSADGQHLVSSGLYDSVIKIWNVSTGACIKKIQNNDLVTGIACGSNNRHLAFCSGKTVKIYDLQADRFVGELQGHQANICSVCYSQDGRYLLSAGSFDNSMKIWNIADGNCLKTITLVDDVIQTVQCPARAAGFFVRGRSTFLSCGNIQSFLTATNAPPVAIAPQLPATPPVAVEVPRVDGSATCPVCLEDASYVAADQIFVTNCCKNFLCKDDFDQLERLALENSRNYDDSVWRRDHGDLPFPPQAEQERRQATCPACRHYPLTIEKTQIVAQLAAQQPVQQPAATALPAVRVQPAPAAVDAATEQWILANTKPCPNCHVRIERNSGNNIIQCFKCKHDFCWTCLAQCSSRHHVCRR